MMVSQNKKHVWKEEISVKTGRQRNRAELGYPGFLPRNTLILTEGRTPN
jgi:hypothetical protein